MKKLLMKFKVNMLFVVILSLVAGMAGNYFFDNRWLGLIIALPLCALYIYQVYQVQADYREQHARKKHTNKYRSFSKTLRTIYTVRSVFHILFCFAPLINTL